MGGVFKSGFDSRVEIIHEILRGLELFGCAYEDNAYCSRLNPGGRGAHLTIQLSWIALTAEALVRSRRDAK